MKWLVSNWDNVCVKIVQFRLMVIIRICFFLVCAIPSPITFETILMSHTLFPVQEHKSVSVCLNVKCADSSSYTFGMHRLAEWKCHICFEYLQLFLVLKKNVFNFQLMYRNGKQSFSFHQLSYFCGPIIF